MAISYESIGQKCITLEYTGTLNPGEPCTISASSTVAASSEGDHICGVVTGTRGGFAGVIVEGFVTLPYTGTAPACGYTKLSAAGSGKVKADANGTEYAVFAVDTANSNVTFLL